MKMIPLALALLVAASTASAQQVRSNAAGPAVFGGVAGDVFTGAPGALTGLSVTPLDSVSFRITFTATFNEPSAVTTAAGSYVFLAFANPSDALKASIQSSPTTVDLGAQVGHQALQNPPLPGVPGSAEVIDWGGFTPQGTPLEIAVQVKVFKTSGEPGAANPVLIVTLPVDSAAPGSLQALTATPGPQSGDVHLQWTATGDDGFAGQASYYGIRMSATPIVTTADFNAAGTVPEPAPAPAAAGSPQQMTVHGMATGELHYFAIGAYDEANNLGALSTTFIVLAGPAAGVQVGNDGVDNALSCSAGGPAAASLLPLLLLLALLPLRTLQS